MIRPVEGWRRIDFAELWDYRELFWALCRRDIKVRYRQTVLGASWAILQPLVSMLIFTVIFGRLANIPSEGYPYPVFVFSGLLPWMFFSTVVSSGSAATVGSAQMVSKIYFPRLLVPLSSVGSPFVDLAIASVILVLLMALYGVSPGASLVFLPLCLVGMALVALGIGTAISAITVSYRDFRFVVPFMVQIWMYITPVVYPPSFIPESWRWLLYLNPMTGFVDGFRAAFLDKPVSIAVLLISLVYASAIFYVGLKYYRKVEQRFADVI